jgi:hypothetical protein
VKIEGGVKLSILYGMSVITSTSGRLHREFMCLLFLQVHRTTDRFFCNFMSSASVIQP